MRLLIDGYNLMHAVVLSPGRRLGPDGLRKLRHRFLNDLAGLLEPLEAHQTTIVFDAAGAPEGLPRASRHKGMTLLYAAPGEVADDRLEQLIAQESAPKRLTVVSSDHRIRLAAQRKRATIERADDFWSRLQDRRARARRRGQDEAPSPTAARERPAVLSADEAAYWQEEFRHVAESPEAREAFRHADFVPTDDEIRRIAREVEEESRRGR